MKSDFHLIFSITDFLNQILCVCLFSETQISKVEIMIRNFAPMSWELFLVFIHFWKSHFVIELKWDKTKIFNQLILMSMQKSECANYQIQPRHKRKNRKYPNFHTGAGGNELLSSPSERCQAAAATCWSLIKADFLTWRMPVGLNMLVFLTKSCTGLRCALISFSSLFCITSSVGGEPGCGRGFILATITTTATRSDKCVLDCIFVEVGMFALAHTNISG